MSQHNYSAKMGDTHVNILMGWDRILNYHFMVIEAAGRDWKPETLQVHESCGDAEEGIIYSNMFEPDMYELGLDHFQGVLKELGLSVPSSMISEIEKDVANNVGNRSVLHYGEGEFKG